MMLIEEGACGVIATYLFLNLYTVICYLKFGLSTCVLITFYYVNYILFFVM